MLFLNSIAVSFVLIIMGILQWFLSISEESLGKTESQILRIRRGREKFYRLIPTRLISRLWGAVHDVRLLHAARPFLFSVYSKIYGVRIEEAADQNLYNYQNLQQFFRRKLKKGVRPISPAKMVSPCDGKIMTQGRVFDGIISQVKGTTFTLSQFLGPSNNSSDPAAYILKGDDADNRKRYTRGLLKNPDTNCMYYSVIYLAPGDYHRFHSPVDWKVSQRRHFPGELYSVNPSITSWFDNLFVLNERVCLLGEWMHGFFSYTAVGATMVGSIKLPWDPELKTNQKSFDRTKIDYNDRECAKEFSKGDEIGEFNLGSTIVLAFEAPRGLNFKFGDSEFVRLGQTFISKMLRVQSMPNLLFTQNSPANETTSRLIRNRSDRH